MIVYSEEKLVSCASILLLFHEGSVVSWQVDFSGLVCLHLNAFSLKSTFINRFDLSTLLFLVPQRCHFATSILLSKHSLEFLSLISSSLRFTTGNG